MFTHLRYLAIVSFTLMIAASGLLVYYVQSYKNTDISNTTLNQIHATFVSYAVTVWDRYAAEIIANPASPYLPSFTNETNRFLKNHPIRKVTIFSPDGTRLYYQSSNDVVTTDGSTRVALFDLPKVIAGKSVIRSHQDVFLAGSKAPNSPHTMLQAIVPIARTASTTPDALAEIYIDITEQTRELRNGLYLFLGGIISLFTLLITILLLTANRAEGIITKQHEVNMELIAAAAQAEAQSRDKSQFLASVSHELRTPLNAIIGFSDIIRNEAREKLEKIHQEYVDDINASGKHLLSLINDILDFSKAEAGKLQIEWAETDTTKVVRNSLRMVLPRAEAGQVTLVEDLPNHHLVIVTDAKKLRQVLLNLLSNSVKFTPAGGEVRCHAWNDVVTGALHIQVRDTGIGIAPKDISRVMTPFGQVDSALSRKYEGTGLGLPLAKKFVESMGGTFTIQSQIKVGTTVTITLPKAPPGWGTAAMNDYPTSPQEQPDVAPAAQ
jgi:two-component system, cell cycle sensor histidine kinase PleC